MGFSKALEEFKEWKLPEDSVAEDAVAQANGTFTGGPQADKERKRKGIASCGAHTDHLTEPIEPSDNSPKPANFISRDGLLARCVRMLAAEGYSQTRIARELRLNRRTVTCLLQKCDRTARMHRRTNQDLCGNSSPPKNRRRSRKIPPNRLTAKG